MYAPQQMVSQSLNKSSLAHLFYEFLDHLFYHIKKSSEKLPPYKFEKPFNQKPKTKVDPK